MDGRVTGRAMARPVRIGLVFEPSAEMLRLAVEQATLLWGGQYQPFFRPGHLDRTERVSRWLGVDVLLALDRAGASEEAAALDGYQWRGRDGWGRWRLPRITSTTGCSGRSACLMNFPGIPGFSRAGRQLIRWMTCSASGSAPTGPALRASAWRSSSRRGPRRPALTTAPKCQLTLRPG